MNLARKQLPSGKVVCDGVVYLEGKVEVRIRLLLACLLPSLASGTRTNKSPGDCGVDTNDTFSRLQSITNNGTLSNHHLRFTHLQGYRSARYTICSISSTSVSIPTYADCPALAAKTILFADLDASGSCNVTHDAAVIAAKCVHELRCSYARIASSLRYPNSLEGNILLRCLSEAKHVRSSKGICCRTWQ